MCGIAGFSLSPEDTADARDIACAMLSVIEERGGDATGMAWFDNAGKCWYQKKDITAKYFLPTVRQHLPKDARCVILHTRLATQGTHLDPANNHPILSGQIVGVHNGMIDNDRTLAVSNSLVLEADVDSEIIFAMLDEFPKAASALAKIQGSMAVAWLDITRPQQLNIARGAYSPLVIVRAGHGSVFFGSTEQACKVGRKAARLAWTSRKTAPEGTVFAYKAGAMISKDTFTPLEPYWHQYLGTGYTPGHRGHFPWNSVKDWPCSGATCDGLCSENCAALYDPDGSASDPIELPPVPPTEAEANYDRWLRVYGEYNASELLIERDFWRAAEQHLMIDHFPNPTDTWGDFCGECDHEYGCADALELAADRHAAIDAIDDLMARLDFPNLTNIVDAQLIDEQL